MNVNLAPKSAIANRQSAISKHSAICNLHSAILLAFALLPFLALADGIPEPGIILYGTVHNLAGDTRPTAGAVNWTVTTSPGASIPLTTPLANLNGQFSYRLRIPFETVVGSQTPSGTSFILNAATTAYNRANVTVTAGTNNTSYPATIVSPAVAVFNFNSNTRGLAEQINLEITAPGVAGLPWDSGGLPDNGTNQPGPSVAMVFTGIAKNPGGGVRLDWANCPSNFTYRLWRVGSLGTASTNYSLVQTFTPTTAGAGYYVDTNVNPQATYFYRLSVP